MPLVFFTVVYSGFYGVLAATYRLLNGEWWGERMMWFGGAVWMLNVLLQCNGWNNLVKDNLHAEIKVLSMALEEERALNGCEAL